MTKAYSQQYNFLKSLTTEQLNKFKDLADDAEVSTDSGKLSFVKNMGGKPLVLGSGTSGTVYEMIFTTTINGKEILIHLAIKITAPKEKKSPEIQLLQELKSPTMLFGSDFEDNSSIIFMPLLKPLPITTTPDMILRNEMIAGLNQLIKIHETGFHGDLKVENMMQTLDGLFTWIDYGEYKTRAEGASSPDPLTFLNGTQMTAAAADSLPFLSDPDLWRRIEADQKIEILQSMALNTYLRSFVQRLVPLHSGYEAS